MTSSHASHHPILEHPILHALARHWWLLLVRGICAAAFGVAALVWPAMTLTTLTLFFGIYALIDGTLAVIAAATGNVQKSRWWLAICGIAGILAGVFTFMSPGITALVLLLFIASWSMVVGVMQIVGSILLRKEIKNEWLLFAGGVLSVIFGLVLFVYPGAGALAMILVIGLYAIMHGALLIVFAFRLRKHEHAKS